MLTLGPISPFQPPADGLTVHLEQCSRTLDREATAKENSGPIQLPPPAATLFDVARWLRGASGGFGRRVLTAVDVRNHCTKSVIPRAGLPCGVPVAALALFLSSSLR